MDVAGLTMADVRTLSKEEIIKAELAWMLESQVPPLVAEIGTIIITALGCCTPTFADAAPNRKASAPATLAITSSNSDLVKGYMTVDGTAIVKGELTMKLPHYNRGNLVKVTINPNNPPVLQQVQAARNYLLLAYEAFESYPKASVDREALLELLNSVSAYVKKAKSALTRIDESDVFPNKEGDPKNFSPDIPDDLVVEFHVNQASLIVSVFALNYHQPGIPLQIQSKILGKFRNLKLDTYKNRPVEVLDELTVESTSPPLTTLIRAVHTVNGLCEDLKMKMNILR